MRNSVYLRKIVASLLVCAFFCTSTDISLAQEKCAPPLFTKQIVKIVKKPDGTLELK